MANAVVDGLFTNTSERKELFKRSFDERAGKLRNSAKSPNKLCKSYSNDPSYGTVDATKVYLVHLGDHLSFCRMAFEQIMFDNWPQLFTKLNLHGGPQTTPPEERAAGRHCGLSMFVELSGIEVHLDGLAVWFVDAGTQTWMCPARGELRIRQSVALQPTAWLDVEGI